MCGTITQIFVRGNCESCCILLSGCLYVRHNCFFCAGNERIKRCLIKVLQSSDWLRRLGVFHLSTGWCRQGRYPIVRILREGWRMFQLPQFSTPGGQEALFFLLKGLLARLGALHSFQILRPQFKNWGQGEAQTILKILLNSGLECFKPLCCTFV